MMSDRPSGFTTTNVLICRSFSYLTTIGRREGALHLTRHGHHRHIGLSFVADGLVYHALNRGTIGPLSPVGLAARGNSETRTDTGFSPILCAKPLDFLYRTTYRKICFTMIQRPIFEGRLCFSMIQQPVLEAVADGAIPGMGGTVS
jgi:hypothetical protein